MPSEFATDPALRAAGFIGVWNTDVSAALSVLDEGAASVMAGDIRLAGKPLALEIALKQTHPRDQTWVFERIKRVRHTGGSFSAEFRVLTLEGDVRWVLTRGILAPDEAGAMRGRGAYIDTTDNHESPFLQSDVIEIPESDPLIIAADRSLEAHSSIIQTEDRKLRRLSERLLSEIGYVLARRMRAG